MTGAPSGGGVLGNTDSYNGIEANTVSVTNSGTIRTDGSAAFGIAAISVGGGGGLLNGSTVRPIPLSAARSIITAAGQSNGAAVTVDNTGTVITATTRAAARWRSASLRRAWAAAAAVQCAIRPGGRR